MGKCLDRLYQKNPLSFALLWIGVYCFANSFANLASEKIGINSSVTCMVNLLLSLALLQWIRSNGLMTYFGLCKSPVPASKFLWYLPLALFASTNLWLGIGRNLPLPDMVCYMLSMLCVGFLEEVILLKSRPSSSACAQLSGISTLCQFLAPASMAAQFFSTTSCPLRP